MEYLRPKTKFGLFQSKADSGWHVRATLPPRLCIPPGPDGLIRIWLDREFVDRLGRMREPGESYSDVILRMATP